MKRILILVVLTFSVLSYAQDKFFNPKDIVNVGAYYYPEHWPENEWDQDLSKMAELGFEFTHFGEFAWSRMEPTEGNFDFSWLDKAIDIADKKKE